MLTNRGNALPTRWLLAGALLVVFTLAACGSAAAPSPSSEHGLATPQPTPTAVPGDGGSGAGNGGGIGTDPGQGGGSDPGNGGGGILFPIPPNPGDDPNLGDATYLTPAKDLINQRPMNVQLVRAFLGDDGRVTADLRWWSGVAPCNQLDRVEIERDDAAKTIHLTVIEGSGQGDMMCIEIAQLNATTVDLGELPAGTWTISAEGEAPTIKIDLP
jgi:hypothetical protein